MLSLLAESWTWYAFVVVILCARYASRWLQLGSIKAFQAEDYIMVLVFAFYTVLVTVMNIVAHLDTNLMLPSDIPLLTPESTKSRIRGSKLVLVVEQSMIMTQWGCKICLLLLYNKLTFGLKQQLAVKVVAAYVVISWLVMEILYFGVWCRPITEYWAVPTDNVQCSTALHHLITNAVFNITSDLMMLSIPVPLLVRSQLPKANKLILCVLFSLGLFVVLCAVLNKYYSFHNPFSPLWTYWYIREASTAIYVANMPMCWSLMRRLFKVKAFNGISSGRSRSKSVPIATTYDGVGSTRGTKSGIGPGSRILIDRRGGGNGGRRDTSNNKSWFDRDTTRITRTESEEFIVGGGGGKKDVPLEIWESTEVNVDRGSVGGNNLGPTSSGDMSKDSDMVAMRTAMYDGTGKDYETTTTVTVSPAPGFSFHQRE